MATPRDSSNRPSVVLVHGAFADGFGWSRVISLLQTRGCTVTAVQNPLTSLADDVATTRRTLEAQPGSVILVGHSYGGAVITAAAAGNTKVKALVYIAAFAPEVGETLSSLLGRGTPSDIGPALTSDSGGFVFIDRAKFHDVFAKDLPTAETKVLAATQKPIAGAAFTSPIPAAAWKQIPSWYLVATQDRAIHPELQRLMAKRIGARTTEVEASHVPFLSRPEVVAGLIEQAANEVTRQEPAGAM
jgi:pimeloyl-ACP methyl ester carboxylesterase